MNILKCTAHYSERVTLGIRHVRAKYADIRRCTFLYAEQKICQRKRAYSIYATQTLTIRKENAEYARHTLNTQDIHVC